MDLNVVNNKDQSRWNCTLFPHSLRGNHRADRRNRSANEAGIYARILTSDRGAASTRREKGQEVVILCVPLSRSLRLLHEGGRESAGKSSEEQSARTETAAGCECEIQCLKAHVEKQLAHTRAQQNAPIDAGTAARKKGVFEV